MSKILNTQNAEITTVVVAVETITISGKQVTQSVFKQLYEGRLFTGTQQQGTPWGIVNYCPTSDCKASGRELALYGPLPTHIHVVWQVGEELRRTTIWAKRPRPIGDEFGPARTGEVLPLHIFTELEEDLPHLFIAV